MDGHEINIGLALLFSLILGIIVMFGIQMLIYWLIDLFIFRIIFLYRVILSIAGILGFVSFMIYDYIKAGE